MKTFLLGTIALLGAFVFAASAADVSGKWTADVPGRDGNTMTQTYNLKADGDKLTGTVQMMQGEQPISDGKIDGDNISFTVAMSFNGNDVKLLFKGKVDGDKISFTREREGGNGRKQEFVAKRTTT